MDNFGFEFAKLVTQLVGAGIVAWLTVKLALGRYKAEKVWERQLSAYVDAVTALNEMKLVLSKWIDEYFEHREPDDDYREAQRKRYRQARIGVENSAALAQLLVPGETASLLMKVVKDLESTRAAPDLLEALERDYATVRDGLEKLLVLAKQTRAVG